MEPHPRLSSTHQIAPHPPVSGCHGNEARGVMDVFVRARLCAVSLPGLSYLRYPRLSSYCCQSGAFTHCCAPLCGRVGSGDTAQSEPGPLEMQREHNVCVIHAHDKECACNVTPLMSYFVLKKQLNMHLTEYVLT